MGYKLSEILAQQNKKNSSSAQANPIKNKEIK